MSTIEIALKMNEKLSKKNTIAQKKGEFEYRTKYIYVSDKLVCALRRFWECRGKRDKENDGHSKKI